MSEYYRLLSYLETALAISDLDKETVELELTRDDVSLLIQALEAGED